MKSFFLAALASLAAAVPFSAPAIELIENDSLNNLTSRAFGCSNLPRGLSASDCQYMSNIGMAGHGSNPTGNAPVWVGSNGNSVFRFHNRAGVAIILIFWNGKGNSFVSGRAPDISYSIPNGGDVTLSLNDNLAGAFAAIYAQRTSLNNAGQIWNTWGEWSTGAGGTLDVTREPNMHGNGIQIHTNNGCNSQWANGVSQCAFTCTQITNSQYDSCYQSGTYRLDNCANGSQPGASSGYDPGAGGDSGGCQGWHDADITFFDH